MTFIDWFYDLKEELWKRFTLKIEDFEKFTSVINDFKKNGFDAPKIMEKYISSISLDDKINKETDEIQILYSQKIELNKSMALARPSKSTSTNYEYLLPA
jgi:membrane protease subunit (stomatin/prohibitin family)